MKIINKRQNYEESVVIGWDIPCTSNVVLVLPGLAFFVPKKHEQDGNVNKRDDEGEYVS